MIIKRLSPALLSPGANDGKKKPVIFNCPFEFAKIGPD